MTITLIALLNGVAILVVSIILFALQQLRTWASKVDNRLDRIEDKLDRLNGYSSPDSKPNISSGHYRESHGLTHLGHSGPMETPPEN